MDGKVPERRVSAVSQGEGRGVNVPISAQQLREAGVDPDANLEVNRLVFDTDRAEMRLRFYEKEEEDAR